MSQTKKYKFQILLMLMLVCFFMFGCKNETPVDNISFNIGSGNQIVLIVGQTLEMNEYITVSPSYATNKGYDLISYNEDVVKVVNNKLLALKEDTALIKVVSRDNPLKEDMMTVVVKSSQEKLAKPLNLAYDSETQTFSFGSVMYASSYTIKINGQEIELGNSTVFNMSQYNGNVFDSLLIAQVKANAPEYSFALTSSNYTNEYKIYQAGPARNLRVEGGVVKFDKFSANNIHNVYLNNAAVARNITESFVSLKSLNEIYAGQVVSCKVEAVVAESVKQQYGADVQYFNSTKQTTAVNVLDVPTLRISSSQITWQNVSHAAGYSIWVDGIKKAETINNYFDLLSLSDYDDIITSAASHEVKVLPLLAEDSVGVAQTTLESVINVQRLDATTIECDKTDLVWTDIDNVSVYSISLLGANTNLNSSTVITSFSMNNYPAGEYTIKITAIANQAPNANGVHFLSSKTVEKTFVKYEALDAYIENYVLNIANLNENDCEIRIDDLTTEFESLLEQDKLDLSNISFSAGEHEIVLKRLGDKEHIESDLSSVEFTQLEKIESVSIADGVARVSRTSINQTAIIKFVTSGSKIEDITHIGTSYAYNSETVGNDLLPAANDYVTKVYVEGDGSSTFSYRENGQVAVCCEVGFEVLSSPTDFAVDKQNAVLSFNNTSDRYKLYINDGPTHDLTSSSYNISLDNGSVSCNVQSIGDGSQTLNSVLSQEIIITRLQTPILTYDNTNDIISKTDANDAVIVAGYEFTHNGTIVNDYDFNSAFNLEDDAVGNVFTLTAVAVDGKDNNFYLNSFAYELTLNQINNSATISLNGLENMLIIQPTGHIEQYDLVVEFALNDGSLNYTAEFVTKLDQATGNIVLSNGLEGENEIILPYTFNGGYVIQLIDENHNAIIQDMNNEFALRVRYVKPSTGNDNLINSDYSESATLNLNRIDAVTEIYINENNQIVLTTNHTQEFGVVGVVMLTSTFGYIVESNGEGVLVCDKYISNSIIGSIAEPVGLNYTYSYNDIENKSYYAIDILNENYELIIPGISSSFTAKVKYSFNHNGIETDLDSDFSEEKTITIQPVGEISREGQSIKIKNIKETYTYLNYSLLINNYPISLDTTAVNENGFIVFDVEYIYQTTPSTHLKDVNVVEVVVKNIDTTNEMPILSMKGGSISIQKTNTIELSSYKYNNNEDGFNNNSLVVSFDTYSTSYYKIYTIEIYNNGNKVFSNNFEDDVAVDGEIEIRLDNISELDLISGMLDIVAYVQTSGVENSINMFNSINSNSLYINKIEAPTNLYVLDSTLYFNSVFNVVGYEVYEKTGAGYIKLSAQLLTSNYFNIANMNGTKQLVVKAISQTGNYTNSTYSEVITINKLAQPVMSVANGKILITFSNDMLALTQYVSIVPEITNNSMNKFTLDLSTLDLTNLEVGGTTTLVLEPYLIMQYNIASLMSEKLTLQLKVNQISAYEGVFYINSDTAEISCYGLFEPTNIKKTTNDNNLVEMISWTASEKNVLNGNPLSVGYIFKIEYNNGVDTTIYYSDDKDLKYYDNATKTYVSYPTHISGTSAVFPAGYGLNQDGTLQVLFGAGTYKVSVQSVPLSVIDGYNLCSSKYSASCDFEVMTSSILTVSQGKVVWEANNNANYYLVSIYDQNGTEPLFVDKVTTAEYDFSNTSLNAYTGVYKVVVKAVSTRDDTINSADSLPLYVYRLPKAETTSVDDGNLIISSTAYFESIIVELVDKEGTVQVLGPYTNLSLQKNLELLEVDGKSIQDWSKFTDEILVDVAQKFSIDLNNLWNVFDGRDYTINVKLIGNTSDKLGIISSVKATTLSNMTATKLKPNATNVNLGVIQFKPDSNYATISSEGVYLPLVDLNYSFNGVTSSAFWNETAVYKVVLTTASGPNTIYAVDYYSLTTAITKGTISSSEYELANGEYGLYAWVKYPYTDNGTQKTLYFHVFQDNKINLRDYDELIHYSMEEKMTHGVNTFTCASTTSDIILVGTITVDIYMLGGDSLTSGTKVLGFLSAKSNALLPFECYATNELTSFEGQVQFDNLIPMVDGKAIDHPVYKLEVSPINNQSSENTTIFYIYHTTEADARIIASRYDRIDYANEDNYNKAIFIQAVNNTVNGALLFDMSRYFAAGTYKVSIKTLAGLGDGTVDADDYLINSRSVAVQTFQKLTDTAFTASEGVLHFKQSYVISDGREVYYEDYEITLYDTTNGDSYVYNINGATDGLSIDSSTNVVSYILPDTYGGGKQYQIKIRAMAKDNLILNGTYKQVSNQDVVFTFEKSLGISEDYSSKLRIENGILKWKVLDLENYVETVIQISFLDENRQTKTIQFKVEDLTRYEIDGEYQYHYHKFTDDKYNFITSGSTEIKDTIIYSGQTTPSIIVYSITAYTKGKTTQTKNILNSNFASVVTTTRLSAVQTDEIKTIDGLLTWNEIQNAVSYEVILSGDNNYTFETSTTSIDFLQEGYGIEVGTYNIQIRALGSNNITSMLSTPKAEGFAQLAAVDLSTISIQDSNIVWSSVEKANAYKIVFEYTDLAGQKQTIIKDDITSTSYTAPSDISGLFTITISAISKGEGKEFNGKPTTFTSSKEAPMQVENFEFDAENSRFVIDVKEGNFLSGDKLLIVYDFAEYVSGGTKTAQTKNVTISYQEGTYRYYYPITAMGVYTEISVRVTRTGTVPSNTVAINDIDFNLFAYGDGTDENPYRINIAQHLLNIDYFPSANYVMTSSINMSTVNVQERISTYGAIICNEFSGTLDGSVEDVSGNKTIFSIFGFNIDELAKTDTISLTDAHNFALFKSLNGATIKNLTIGSENIQLILVNTFANSTGNMVKLSVIATGAQNSIIDNVDVLNFKTVINSSENSQLSGEVYISGFVGTTAGVAIKNSTVNFTAEINIAFTNRLYAGGVIASANETDLEDSVVTFNLAIGSSYLDNIISYLGGAIGYYEGSIERLTGIFNTTAEINFTDVKVMNAGGLVGFARYIYIDNSSTNGSYSKHNINYQVNLGGIVGAAQSSIITNSGTTINFDVSVVSADQYKRIGAIAGDLTITENISCEIVNCYMNTEFRLDTYLTTEANSIILGVYGKADSAVSIENCYQKIN